MLRVSFLQFERMNCKIAQHHVESDNPLRTQQLPSIEKGLPRSRSRYIEESGCSKDILGTLSWQEEWSCKKDPEQTIVQVEGQPECSLEHRTSQGSCPDLKTGRLSLSLLQLRCTSTGQTFQRQSSSHLIS